MKYQDAFTKLDDIRNSEGYNTESAKRHRKYCLLTLPSKYSTYYEKDIRDISTDDLRDTIETLGNHTGKYAVNHYITQTKCLFRVMFEEGFIDKNIAFRIKKQRMLETEKSQVVPFTFEQMTGLFKAINRKSFSGYRDYTMISMLFDTGLRISECLAIKVNNIDFNSRLIAIPNGKGGKPRTVAFSNELETLLKEYIKQCKDASFIQTKDSDLWWNIDGRVMTKRHFDARVKIHGGKAGILDDVRVSAHTFRHTFALNFLINGGDSLVLQKMLGHSTLTMTQRYVNLLTDKLQNVYADYSPLANYQKAVDAKKGKHAPRYDKTMRKLMKLK